MNKTLKKWIAVLGIAVLTLGLVFAIKQFSPKTQVGAKEITVVVEDRSGETTDKLLDAVYNTDAEYLGQLIDEHADELKPQLSESNPAWGRSINGLMDLTIEDWNTGPWWMYTVNGGYADAIDMCAIADGDVVVFYYSSQY